MLTGLELGVGCSVSCVSIYMCFLKKAFVSLGYSYFGAKETKLLPEIYRNTVFKVCSGHTIEFLAK